MILKERKMKKMEMKTLYDVLPASWTGLFIDAMTDAAWNEDETVDPAKVDSAYIYGHSGNKWISSFVEHFLDADTGKLDSTAISEIAGILYEIFGESWNRLWEINKAEYDPLRNYDRTEEHDTDESGKETLDRTHEGFDTSVTEGNTADNKDENKVYGYNSANPVAASENSSKHKSTNTYTPGVSDKEEKSFTDRNTHTEIHAFGNIGVTSAQDMSQQSIALWKWKFWQTVMDDIDTYLTLSVY